MSKSYVSNVLRSAVGGFVQDRLTGVVQQSLASVETELPGLWVLHAKRDKLINLFEGAANLFKGVPSDEDNEIEDDIFLDVLSMCQTKLINRIVSTITSEVTIFKLKEMTSCPSRCGEEESSSEEGDGMSIPFSVMGCPYILSGPFGRKRKRC